MVKFFDNSKKLDEKQQGSIDLHMDEEKGSQRIIGS
jgi:hypothetical protein